SGHGVERDPEAHRERRCGDHQYRHQHERQHGTLGRRHGITVTGGRESSSITSSRDASPSPSLTTSAHAGSSARTLANSRASPACTTYSTLRLSVPSTSGCLAAVPGRLYSCGSERASTPASKVTTLARGPSARRSST